MVLHCATRTGFLSYLYQQRHQIAHSIGIIAEIPIAMCNSNYNFNKGLQLDAHDDEMSDIPATLIQAQEIILFSQTALFNFEPYKEIIIKDYIAFNLQKEYTSPALPVFHPPA